MQTTNEITRKLNEFGEVDYHYYLDQAHTLRSEVAAELAGQLIDRIKKLLKREPTADFHNASQV